MSYVTQISQNDIIDSTSCKANWEVATTIIQQYTHVLNTILTEIMRVKSYLCILCACVYYFNAPASKSQETSFDSGTDDKYLRLVMGLFFLLSRHPSFYPFNVSGFSSLNDLVRYGFDDHINDVKGFLNASHLEDHAFGKHTTGLDLGQSAARLTDYKCNDSLIKKQTNNNSENASQDISSDGWLTQYLNVLKSYINAKENIF